jgi:hypothetical protein
MRVLAMKCAIAPFCRIGGGATFQIGLAAGNGFNPVTGGDWQIIHFQLGQFQFPLDRINQFQAQIHRVANRLLVIVQIRKRQRRIAVCQRYALAAANIVQRVGRRLCWQQQRHTGQTGDEGDPWFGHDAGP